MAKRRATINTQKTTLNFQGHEFVVTSAGGMVTAENPQLGRKSRQVGGSPPEAIARMLASELVSEAAVKRDRSGSNDE
jgi:hypothetical protein